MAAAVLGAVSPRNRPTSPSLDTSTVCPRDSRPSPAKIRPSSRATVVLPVPGGPTNSTCGATISRTAAPCSRRRRSRSNRSTRLLISSLTPPRPTIASSSASTPATDTPEPDPDPEPSRARCPSGMSTTSNGSPSNPSVRTAHSATSSSARLRMSRALPKSPPAAARNTAVSRRSASSAAGVRAATPSCASIPARIWNSSSGV